MKKLRLFGLVGLMVAGSSTYAQSTDIIPASLQKEEKEFLEAVRSARIDYNNTEALEQFIYRYPASRFYTQAIMELERAQILNSGTYSYSLPQPELYKFKATEQPFQYLFENQKELMGDEPDFKMLRERYEQLVSDFSDPAYFNEANYCLGYIDYVEGNYDSAMNRFNSLPKERKYEQSVPFYKMQILYAQGDSKGALDLINGSSNLFANLSPEQAAEVNRIKAECLAQNGDNNNALEYYKKYMESVDYPVASSAYNCAVLAYEKGDYKLVEKALSKAVDSDNENVKQYSYMLLGQSYLLNNEIPKAKMAFDRAASLSADSEVQEYAAYNKAVLVHDTSYSLWGDEVAQFESFLNTYPNSKYADNVSTYLTEVYMTTKNYESALASIRKINKPNQTILDAKQHLLYQIGIQDYVNGDYVSANKNFTEALTVNATNPAIQAQSYYWRGESRYNLSSFTEALDDYNKFNAMSSVVEDRHLRAVGNYSLGYVYLNQKDFANAAKSFEKYVSYPNELGTETYYDAIVRLGDCSYYTRDFAKAESYYSSVADKNSKSSPYALFQQAFVLGLQKKYSQKQNILDKLIALYPSNDYLDEAWLEKGNTSLLQNETGAAINAFKYIVDNYPNSSSAPQAAVQLAMAYNNSGQTAMAQKIYEMVAEKYPNTDEAITAMQDLKTISTNTLFAEMPTALANGDYEKVIANYERLSSENVDFRDLQKMQLMAAKSYFALGDNDKGMELLQLCSEDIRTEAGSEAKYLLAQKLYNKGMTDEALSKVTEFIQEGTSHQYWLARCIILMSDIAAKNDDKFTAVEYLKSLQSNYSVKDDIQTLIESRLSNLK